MKKGNWINVGIVRILRNQTYAGTAYFGKRKKVKQFDNELGQWVDKYPVNDKSNWLAIETTPIVGFVVPPKNLEDIKDIEFFGYETDIELRENAELAFQYIQKMIDGNRWIDSAHAKHEYLLRGFIFCECGRRCDCSTSTKKYKNGGTGVFSYYTCYSKVTKHYPTCEFSKGFPCKLVDQKVWEWVEKTIKEPEMVKYHLESVLDGVEARNEEIKKRIAYKEIIIDKSMKAASKIIDEIDGEGDIFSSLWEVKLEELKTTIQEQKSDIAEMEKQIKSSIVSDQMLETWKRLGEIWGMGLGSADFATKRQIIDTLGLKVCVSINDAGNSQIVIQWHTQIIRLWSDAVDSRR